MNISIGSFKTISQFIMMTSTSRGYLFLFCWITPFVTLTLV